MKKAMLMMVVAIMVLTAGSAFALTVTQNFNVLASVPERCQITAANDLDFLSYDPTAGTPTDADTTYTFRCNRGTTFEIYITRTNQMTDGTDKLSYDIYTDALRTTAYPSATTGVLETSVSSVPETRTVYGRIAAGQWVGAANYSEIVTLTVEY